MSYAKSAACQAAFRLGLARLAYAVTDRQRVLSYHDILPDGLRQTTPSDALTVSASAFRRQLHEAARHRRLGHRLGEPGTVMVTIDDGNLNGFECARPILNELGIRAWFFIPLDTAINGRIAWPSLVARWCEQSPPGMAPPCGLAEAGIDDDPASRTRAARLLFRAAAAGRSARQDICDHIRPWQDGTPHASEHSRLRFSAMSPAQIRQLEAEGHIVGPHSVFHDVLSTLSGGELRADMEACASAVGEIYNTGIYCYPFGGPGEVDEGVASTCRQTGFTGAFVHVPSPWAPEWGQFGLPRIPMVEEYGAAALHVRLSGLSQHLKSLLAASTARA